MIENIRKYTGLLIVFFALVVLALVVGIKDDIFRGGASGQPVVKIGGRTYSDKEFVNLGSGSLELAESFLSAGDFGLYPFILALTGDAFQTERDAEQFFASRIILRQAKDDFGVHPGDKEIDEFIKAMPVFAGPDRAFNEANYRNFIEKGIGRLGMTETDLRELASDILAFRKINEIVGTGLGVNRDVVTTDLALRDQRISGELVRIDIDSHEAAVEPTDEQIKEYWENLQDAFMTEPRRKFTYIIATPETIEEPVEETEAKEEAAPEATADAAATDEEKAAAEAKKAEEKAKKDAELAEARRKKQNETDAKVDDFVVQLEEQQGAGFEELAKENGWEVVTTELFARSNPPEALNVNLRASSRGGKAVDELFRIEPTSDPVSKLSQPIAIGENQWLVARLDEQEASRAKTFEEAKAEARDRYINEKATEAMRKAAEEAATKIKDGMAAGKSFAEVAKEAGIEETRKFEKITSTHQPDPAAEPMNLFAATRFVDPGSLAENIVETDRTFIVHVASREVEKDPNAAMRIDGELASRANANEMIAMVGWLSDRLEAAKVDWLYRR